MKASLITTVFNEEKTIDLFLKSILNQTKLPEEIIIVDGGSTDGTINKITKFRFLNTKKIADIKIISKKGNRAVGRNEAIRKAKYPIIAIADAGCILDKNWFKNITKLFADKNIDVVAGYYTGAAKTIFQKCLIPYVLVMKDKLNKEEFLPATRSMALKKSIWERAGMFNEKLSHNEDYAFAKELKEAEAKIVFCKDAIVNWIPRKNLKEAFIMFFRFALGDAEAKILRDKVVYIFLRYIFAVYLLILSIVMRSYLLWIFYFFMVCLYIGWSIRKNYKYVGNVRAYFYLPLLQITSDIAVMTGTITGLAKQMSLRSLVSLIQRNKIVSLIICIYVAMMILVLNWGIPGVSHPFPYHMDEWHQLQSVRDFFRLGTVNINGAANGSVFQFFLTGLYLIPFYALHIVNIFAIKSSVTNLSIQTTLFEVLRLNTLLFGVLSTIAIAYIAKRYFRIQPFLAVFLFVFNPLWITLSNYFKYDIALMFWIMLAFLFLLKYVRQNKFLDFLLAGVFSALALSTKLEPFNLLFVYIAVFFLFTPKFYNKIKHLLIGLLSYLTVFMFFGIPDVILGKGSLVSYLVSNLHSTPDETSHVINLGMNYWVYFLSTLYPASFGRVFYFAFIITVLVGMIALIRKIVLQRNSLIKIFNENKSFVVLILLFVSYVVNLLPMRIGALANRLVPLIPLMAIVVAYFVQYVYRKIDSKAIKIVIVILIFVLFLTQFVESYTWYSLKTENNLRAVASKWILGNIKSGTTIGLENIPIYQVIPDILLKEFYLNQYGRGQANKYTYKIVNSKTKNFPKTVILTNDYIEENYFVSSDKKSIVEELRKLQYRKIKTIYLNSSIFSFFNNRLEFYMAAIIPLPDAISVYEKQ
jgi:glycosyltransferase involved in cell wall biosynthesis